MKELIRELGRLKQPGEEQEADAGGASPRAGPSGLALAQGSAPEGSVTGDARDQRGPGTAPVSPLPDRRPQRGGAGVEGRKRPNIPQPREDPVFRLKGLPRQS